MKNEATSFYNAAQNAVNAGLRKYMLNVFSYMSVGLFITAVVAYFMQMSHDVMTAFMSNKMSFLVMLAPIGIVFYMSAKINTLSSDAARALFFVYAALIGISLSPLFIIYTSSSICLSFFITSSMFLSMVIYGYTTGKDLTNFGAYLFMGVIGIIIASVINIFVKSSMMEFVISIIGVVIFTGLTAYDTQKIKSYYYESDSMELSNKKAVFGALSLYMDFVNLFIYILRFIGQRRD